MKAVTFYLGPTTGVSARQLTITRIAGSGDSLPVSATHDADAGAVDNATVNLPDNRIWEAKLVDTLSDASVRPAQVLGFHTGELQYLTHKASQPDGSQFHILSMTDLSSSSSSSSSSVSSSSS